MIDFMPPLVPWLIFMGVTALIFAVVLANMSVKLRHTMPVTSRRLYGDTIALCVIAILAFILSIVSSLLELS